ncbi:alpha/beta-hydrolase [Penicillium canescens]|nr:alpha/beta-hydrolase [Penicillium canescens]
MQNRPLVVFAPGAWSPRSTYDEFGQLLRARGIRSVAVDHPSNGAEPPNKGLKDDVQFLQSFLTAEVDKGEKIVLVGHSYGGFVASGAAAGLGLDERAKRGKLGGVVRIVYIAAFVAERGKNLRDMLGGELWPWMTVKGDYVYCDADIDTLAHDLPDDVRSRRKESLWSHICLASFMEPAVEEPWHTIPSAYIVCDEDRSLPPRLQEQMAQTLIGPILYHLKSAHSPFLSMPRQTADILQELVEGGAMRSMT